MATLPYFQLLPLLEVVEVHLLITQRKVMLLVVVQVAVVVLPMLHHLDLVVLELLIKVLLVVLLLELQAHQRQVEVVLML
jgi:hypothetical protein